MPSDPLTAPALANAPGFLVALEGIDGVGKSTQSRLLAAWARGLGREVVESREPTDGPEGREIRRRAREGRLGAREEMELFLRDRARHVRELVRPALAAGKLVVLDRYYVSSMAYQGARGIDPEEIRRANEAFAPRPDAVLLMELPVEEAVARLRARGAGGPDLFERAEALAQVAGVFAGLEWPEVARLDARLPAQDVQARVREVLGRHEWFRGGG